VVCQAPEDKDEVLTVLIWDQLPEEVVAELKEAVELYLSRRKMQHGPVTDRSSFPKTDGLGHSNGGRPDGATPLF